MMWPDSPSHKRVSRVGSGSTRGVGIWRKAGEYLSGLMAKGWLEWRPLGFVITSEGRRVLGVKHG